MQLKGASVQGAGEEREDRAALACALAAAAVYGDDVVEGAGADVEVEVDASVCELKGTPLKSVKPVLLL